ncbi:transcriptional repressor [Solihabitans fulvus]|uniref:Transcriptional repressor n=1 Tax=Solihabitans fulvus TaxID=1892852 RepID=A0A5B2WIV8_9PSEU|nr:Fur family transcriptional regulator [Solihabitans fulvus]KAA2250720.1 transcriptional repressor [Solihabitans fulvus]
MEDVPSASEPAPPVDAVRSAGLRVTAARIAVLEAIRAGNHLDIDTIANQVRARLGQISIQAVYGAVHAFTAAGLVRRIQPAGSPTRYEARVGDNHHHLVCRECGRITDVDSASGEPPCLEPADDAGYLIDEAEITFWGHCSTCATPAG